MIKYKFKEDVLHDEIKQYIDKTYSQHYAGAGTEKIQTFELISKHPLRGLHFAQSNILKYADRLGEKEGYNRKDVLKIIHYAYMTLWALDNMNDSLGVGKEKEKPSQELLQE